MAISKKEIKLGIGIFAICLVGIQYIVDNVTGEGPNGLWIGATLIGGKYSAQFLLSFCAASIIFSFRRRSVSRERLRESRLWQVLFGDYFFRDYATISALSILYTLVQGILAGLTCYAVNSTLMLIAYSLSGREIINLTGYYAAGALGCGIALLIARISIESYIVIFRAAKDISVIAARKN